MTEANWAGLIQQGMWPVTVLVLVFALRRQIGDFLSAVGGRITHLSVSSVTIELAEVTEEVLSWRGVNGIDVRGLVAAQKVNDSYFDTLRQSLAMPGTADYFVVDLRSDGRKEWLTSRLYIFTYLLSRLKDVRSVVFIATRGDVRGYYLGVASCQDLLHALTAAEPWLRMARFHVEAKLVSQLTDSAASPTQPHPDDLWVPPDLDDRWEQIRTNESHEDPLRIAQQFLQHIQWVQPVGTADPGTTWLRLPDTPGQDTTWEHATWISGSDLTDGILRDAVHGDSSLLDDRSWSAEERVRKAAQARGDFLALLGPNHRFERLIDRRKLLEELGEATVKP